MTDKFRTPPAAERLRIWPREPLDEPHVIVLFRYLSDDGGELVLTVADELAPTPRYAVLPQELAIREFLSLDVDDPAAIAAFTNKFGVIVAPPHWPEWRGDRGAQSLEKTHWHRGRVDVEAFTHYLGITQALAKHAVAHLRDEDVTIPWREYVGVPPQWLLDGRREKDSRDRALFDIMLGWPAHDRVHGEWPRDPEWWDVEDDAWLTFTRLLREGLASRGPHIEYAPRQDSIEGTPRWLGDIAVDLITALCVQIHNMILEDLPVMQCANETCRGPFIRQRDRAEHGQHRTTGVLYCSRGCARAQARRVARRSARDRRNAQKGSS